MIMDVESRKTMKYLHSLAELFPIRASQDAKILETRFARRDRPVSLWFRIEMWSYMPDMAAAASVFQRREYFTREHRYTLWDTNTHRRFLFRYKIGRSCNHTPIICRYARARGKKVMAAHGLFYVLPCFVFLSGSYLYFLAFVLLHFVSLARLRKQQIGTSRRDVERCKMRKYITMTNLDKFLTKSFITWFSPKRMRAR